ncbi:LppP/LprE family lipoprotein [Nocardia australiensis]|uniref:LppP/LprE family lipoprotein n=1 Tax=Nocardia australiensis TaxID=2887191 RepID=UPI001D14914E|nr:LppP/LprE family lipoprotein [Nocardia australiensis]
MNIKSSALIALAAGVVISVAGCSSNTTSDAAGTSTATAPSSSRAAATSIPAGDPQAPQFVQPPGAGGNLPDAPTAQSDSLTAQPETPAPANASTPANPSTDQPQPSPVADPSGSGHGLCFDLNSGLAESGIASLGTPPGGGQWQIQGASNDAISDGCSGVLSWMTVEWAGIHPGTHILFFTDGTYLGTASAKPYAYTEVIGKTRNTVSAQYKWARPEDALCCPQGGPSVVTFTLNGTSVHADGQFPPDN